MGESCSPAINSRGVQLNAPTILFRIEENRRDVIPAFAGMTNYFILLCLLTPIASEVVVSF
jgi:hypothetical protein